MSTKPELLNVTVGDGKYTVIQEASGALKALRNGEEWRDLTGDKLVLTLAQTIEDLRGVAKEAIEELESYHVDWARLNKESPDYDPEYKVTYPESLESLRRRFEGMRK